LLNVVMAALLMTLNSRGYQNGNHVSTVSFAKSRAV
jgi:hypothetical protein